MHKNTPHILAVDAGRNLIDKKLNSKNTFQLYERYQNMQQANMYNRIGIAITDNPPKMYPRSSKDIPHSFQNLLKALLRLIITLLLLANCNVLNCCA